MPITYADIKTKMDADLLLMSMAVMMPVPEGAANPFEMFAEIISTGCTRDPAKAVDGLMLIAPLANDIWSRVAKWMPREDFEMMLVGSALYEMVNGTEGALGIFDYPLPEEKAPAWMRDKEVLKDRSKAPALFEALVVELATVCGVADLLVSGKEQTLH